MPYDSLVNFQHAPEYIRPDNYENVLFAQRPAVAFMSSERFISSRIAEMYGDVFDNDCSWPIVIDYVNGIAFYKTYFRAIWKHRRRVAWRVVRLYSLTLFFVEDILQSE